MKRQRQRLALATTVVVLSLNACGSAEESTQVDSAHLLFLAATSPKCSDRCSGEAPSFRNCEMDAKEKTSKNVTDNDGNTRGILKVWCSPSCQTVWTVVKTNMEHRHLLVTAKMTRPTPTPERTVQGRTTGRYSTTMIFLSKGETVSAEGTIDYDDTTRLGQKFDAVSCP